MPKVSLIYRDQQKVVEAPKGSIIGDVVIKAGLPLEMPCAGRGTCGLCKVLSEGGLTPPDEIEHKYLTDGELAVGNRLACRARVESDVRIVLAPIVVYSNKIFKRSNRYKRERHVPLGIAIDLGSTTVAAFLTMLDNDEVCAGGAGLNQQTIYGADVISRLAAARQSEQDAKRLRRLALSSINQAVDSLKLSSRIKERIQRVTIVGNPAMHHLLLGLPVDSLAVMPFQPFQLDAIDNAGALLQGIFPETARIIIPPLIGGFVGSDALGCLAYFGFDKTNVPMAAIDLGTNGEVMVTDGKRILTASTAAGPAFEGVNISCGSRAVDGAITLVNVGDGRVSLETIADEEPIGLTGSGLLSAINEFCKIGWIEPNGRISPLAPKPKGWNSQDLAVPVTEDGKVFITQWDIRELQKAKGAIRAAMDILLHLLEITPGDLSSIILTGSFGGQIDIESVLGIGMLPPVNREIVKTIANGAGFGAAMFLTDEGFSRAIELAHSAEQIDLDVNAEFIDRFVDGMKLAQG
ncbi:MAG TPA: DUF4445 domain-containing protein [Anaerolineae bacterium]|nr:DUF4445 domain-containing protein [Anaerolineae bacterium]